VQARDYMRGYLARQAMISAYQTLNPASTADDAAALLLRTTQQEFPVVDGAGTLKGMLTRKGLIAGLTERGGATPVSDLMQEVPEVQETACLDSVFSMLQRGPGLVGVVDAQRPPCRVHQSENLAELIMIKSSRAFAASSPTRAAAP
jgi:CBS domain-containing protein